VRFEARELWGESAEPGSCVQLDCFESYLEPDPAT
jgi:nitrile hydratase